MYDIIIVGAGPAGLTAALYALRANKKILLLEKKCYGGQIINADKIDNYPGLPDVSGIDFANALYNQVKRLNGEIKYENVTSIDKDKNVVTNLNTYQAKSIIIATGAKNKELGLKQEHDFIGKGISYCATCDGNFFQNKIVAVVGGGNTALGDAKYLANLAKKVYLIHRNNNFKGEKIYVEELKKLSNVEFIMNTNVVKLNGNNVLESIEIKDNKGNKNNLKVNALFIAIGQKPQNDQFNNILDLDDYGYVISKDGVHTKTDGIYIAGDARQKNLRQLTTAISDGALASTIAIEEML